MFRSATFGGATESRLVCGTFGPICTITSPAARAERTASRRHLLATRTGVAIGARSTNTENGGPICKVWAFTKRAAKAAAIFRTFASEEEIDGLTVEEAYEKRRSALGGGSNTPLKSSSRTRHRRRAGKPGLSKLLADLDRLVPRLSERITEMRPEQAASLLSMVESAENRLEKLHKLLASRAQFEQLELVTVTK